MNSKTQRERRIVLYFLCIILCILNLADCHQPGFFLPPFFHANLSLPSLPSGQWFAIKGSLIVNEMLSGFFFSAGRFTANRPWNGFIFHQPQPPTPRGHLVELKANQGSPGDQHSLGLKSLFQVHKQVTPRCGRNQLLGDKFSLTRQNPFRKSIDIETC